MGYGGCGNGWPNFDAMLSNFWGAGQELSGGCGFFFGAATNFVFGTNPPYTLDDFWQVYPKFFGLATPISGCIAAAGNATVTVPSTNGFQYGQFVQCAGVLPKGSVVVGIGDGTVTFNQPATANSSNATLMVYMAAPVPVGVVQLYLNLATASLVQARWQELWLVGMALYVAHYLTLYAQTDSSETMTLLQNAIHGETPAGAVPGTVYVLSAAPPGGALQGLTVNGLFQVPGVAYTLVGNTITFGAPTPAGASVYATWPVQVESFSTLQPTGAAIAAQGLAGGIQVSKSVGDVSVSYQVLTVLEQFGAYNLTKYGQQLATFAAGIGAGPCVIY